MFHIINQVGSLTIDNYSLQVEPDPAQFPHGLVSIDFDDGWASIFENAIPILEAANINSTQYIATAKLGQEGYVTAQEVQQMNALGHEIGAHTRTHPFLTTLSQQDMELEIAGSKQDLIDLGITPASFAYPFDDYNAQTDAIAQANYDIVRTSDTGFNTATSDIFHLVTQSVEVDTTLTQVQAWIDEAITNKTWLILLFHQINDTGEQFTTTVSDFQSIVNYLVDNALHTVTVSEGAAFY